MGVLGLWQLLAPVGQPVTLESLENKILAVDISIWLNQALKGYRDAQGGAVNNAHLLSLFNRLCKLLFYKIRPIIVFDGGVPELKKQTIINRQQRRAALKQSSREAGLKLLANFLASRGNQKSKPTQNTFLASKQAIKDDLFILPPLQDSSLNKSSGEYDDMEFKHRTLSVEELRYIEDIDIESEDFEALPMDIKQEILATLKENRRRKNWEYYETLPKESNEFSKYQMQCLLKRRKIENKIEEVQRDMQKSHCMDIISLYSDDHEMVGGVSRLMSDDCSHYVLLKKSNKAVSNGINSSLPENGEPKKKDEVKSVVSHEETSNYTEEETESDGDIEEKFLETCKLNPHINYRESDDQTIDLVNRSLNRETIDTDSESSNLGDDPDNPREYVSVCVSVKIMNKHTSNANVLGPWSSLECKRECDAKLTESQKKSMSPTRASIIAGKKNKNSCDSLTGNDSKISESTFGESSVVASESDLEILPSTSREPKISESSISSETSISEAFASTSRKPKISKSSTSGGESFITVSESDRKTYPSTSHKYKISESSACSESSISESNCETFASTSHEPEISKTSAFSKSSISESNREAIASTSREPEISKSSSLNESSILESAHETFPSTSRKPPVSIDPNFHNGKTSAAINPGVTNETPKVKEGIKIAVNYQLDEETDATPSTSSQDNTFSLQDELSGIQLAVQQELQEASMALQAQQAKQERQAATVQEHMVEECKELLRLFGVPYIVSPLEAEAQCAFYDLAQITHGTITDDSDIWLFGGKHVYKNFFAQKKYVEFYKDSEVLAHFGLSRLKLINFALLTGSDYTDGIENVGPVTAMEIISEFSGEGIEALVEFKKWWDEVKKFTSPPKNKVRAKLQKLQLSGTFPNKVVFEAYLKPEVDDSTESFSWGLPDLDSLRDYAREKFGWNKVKVDEALLPVIKRLNERTAQTHLESFFKISLKKEKNLFPSKRIMSALKKINPNGEEDSSCDDPTKPKVAKMTKTASKKRIQAKKRTGVKSGRKNIIKQTVDLSEESSDD